MASHAQLSHAKSFAKANYEIRKDEAEARPDPLEAKMSTRDFSRKV
jgi:hypothetical protein